MNLEIDMQWQRHNFIISTDKTRLDPTFIHDYLCNQSYWAQGRSLEIVERSIQNSLCFGLFEGERQIGFARVVSDLATFAWLCDVFVARSHRGQGLGKWLVECVVDYPDLQKVKYVMLATRDAHELYRQYGNFETPRSLDKWMVRYRDEE
jgi:GNAT superfamily N-acetyltransferase